MKHYPIRTCVGCHTRDRQDRLLRIGFDRDVLVVDPRRRIPGRGAYVHVTPECTQRAVPRGLARSLRTSVAREDAARVRDTLTAMSSLAGGQSQ